MVEDIIRADEENAAGLSKEALNDIIGKWLNQYAFSKAIAESVVEDFARRRSLPCLIYRPSIIVNAIREPYPGWLDSMNGPMVATSLVCLGLVHALPVESDGKSDYVPVDMATNGLLSAIWDYVVNRERNEPQVYNYASSDWNPLVLYKHRPVFYRTVEEYPSAKMIWYPFVLFIPNIYLFFAFHVLAHVFPAIITDVILMIQRKKPRALKMAYMATKQFRVLSYFMNTTWVIKADNVRSIINRMNATDLEEFSFDMKQLDWSHFIELMTVGCRKIAQDPIETLPDARRKVQKLKVLHNTIVTLLWILAFFFLFRIMYNLFCY